VIQKLIFSYSDLSVRYSKENGVSDGDKACLDVIHNIGGIRCSYHDESDAFI
jgi:hypothetical protein